jgi:hypothetical protein
LAARPNRAARSLKPGLDSLESRRLLSGYNVTMDSQYEAGGSIAGQSQPYIDLADFQATDPSGDPVTNPAGFSATIYWGDGTTSTGNIQEYSGLEGLFEVDGSHAYPNPSNGEYNIQVALFDPSGGEWVSSPSIATVEPRPDDLAATPAGNDTFSVATGQRLSGYIAVVTIPDPSLTVTDLTGSITNQTDGTTTPADIVAAGSDTWDVYDTETFNDPGKNDITVNVSDQQGDGIVLQGEVSVNGGGGQDGGGQTPGSPGLLPLLPMPFPNVGPPSSAVTHPGEKFNRSVVEESERLANGVVKGINSLLASGNAVAAFAQLTPDQQANLIRSGIDDYANELQHGLAAAQRDPTGAVARWLDAVVKNTVDMLSDNNAAENAGQQVVQRLLNKVSGPSTPSGGTRHIIKPIAGSGAKTLEGGLENAAFHDFEAAGENMLSSKIGSSNRGIDIASYVGQGAGAQLILTEAKNVSGIVRAASITALGSGRQGVDNVNLRRLESNIDAIRKSIEDNVQNTATQKTLLDQLNPNARTGPILRLVGNTAKGTIFEESTIQKIVDEVSGVVKFQWPPIIENISIPK